jgi:SOS-response transcriptional repressor LexA
MSHDLNDKIKKRVDELGVSERSLLVRAGLSTDLIRDLRRKHGSPTLETVQKIANALDVSPAWLAFGEPGSAPSPEPSVVPILGSVAAGTWHAIDDFVDEPRNDRHLVPDPRFPASAQYGLTVHGESMNLLFGDSDDLLCLDYRKMQRGPQPRHNDIVIVEQLSENASLREVSAKRLQMQVDGPLLVAASDHPKWQNFVLKPTGSEESTEGAGTFITAIVLRSERHWFNI